MTLPEMGCVVVRTHEEQQGFQHDPRCSADHKKHLAALGKKYQVVRDFTVSVATGLTTGFYLYGPGGVGKTHHVTAELERLEVPYKLYNSRMTGRGLYDTLEQFPDAVHVLEDMEQLFQDRGARSVMRSALWGTSRRGSSGRMERLVTWTTNAMDHSCIVTGGLIMTANKPLPAVPELDAVRTRIAYLQLTVSDNEMRALMRHIAGEGYRSGDDYLEPDECLEVCEFIISECIGLNRPLDMRLLINGFSDLILWRQCESGCSWQDLLSTRLKERPTTIGKVESVKNREDRKQWELAVAREIYAATSDRDERKRMWIEKTGKSEPTFYRRLQELQGEASQAF